MNNSIWILLITVLLLGVRHGFDLDHLATIDSITRTVSAKPYLAKATGFLFSLGHGLVVIFVSFLIGSGIMQSHVPTILSGLGNWVSIIFLLVFGAWNLCTIQKNSAKFTVVGGIQTILVHKYFFKKYNPLLIMLIGGLFALSFDTFSQIALFSLSANLLSGYIFSVFLGIIFMLGMMVADGLNGILVSALIQKVDSKSILISRFLNLMIALFSLVTGIITLIKAI